MYVIERSRRTPHLPLELRDPAHRVEGCLSNLWFVPEMRAGQCHFRVDGDSHIVRGIATLLAEFYSGHSPEEILRHDPTFLSEVGITQHLSPNRRNGLARVWDRIRLFAAENQTGSPPAEVESDADRAEIRRA